MSKRLILQELLIDLQHHFPNQTPSQKATWAEVQQQIGATAVVNRVINYINNLGKETVGSKEYDKSIYD